MFAEAEFFVRGSAASVSAWVRVFVALVTIGGAVSSEDCSWLPDSGVSSWVCFDDVGSWSEAGAGDDEVDSTGDGWSESVMNSWVSASWSSGGCFSGERPLLACVLLWYDGIL